MKWTPDAIRKLAASLGWSQEELGAAIGARRRAVNNWANGRSKPSNIFSARLDALHRDGIRAMSENVVFADTADASTDTSADDDVLLRDADFAQTLNHLMALYREALRAGNFLKSEQSPISPDFLVDHDVITGPPAADLDGTDQHADEGKPLPPGRTPKR